MLIELVQNNPDQRKIDEIVKLLNSGAVIVIPTDTIYAFAVSLQSKKGLSKLANFKKVKLKQSEFSLICNDLTGISTYTKPMERNVFKLLKKTLPGPFTYILEASNNVAKIFGSKKKEVGIRIPDHNITREIVKSLNHPLVSSSVHDDDKIIKYSTDPKTIFEKHENEVDAVIDCGYGKNVASTVVDCRNEQIKIIRQGAGILPN
ncbi:MAG: threonylcarbamoyl-AMP synthase [Crocinitomicaceae bacterium]|nr:threonylcarbamoyl-AMP synthase [Crocinitomicaceae bacterium]|tara:strand:+ start:1957 stop:2571 length:615 start_codon:yes stop_codon:yes gene_type:complete